MNQWCYKIVSFSLSCSCQVLLTNSDTRPILRTLTPGLMLRNSTQTMDFGNAEWHCCIAQNFTASVDQGKKTASGSPQASSPHVMRSVWDCACSSWSRVTRFVAKQEVGKGTACSGEVAWHATGSGSARSRRTASKRENFDRIFRESLGTNPAKRRKQQTLLPGFLKLAFADWSGKGNQG